jgi:hypothetical protein
MAVILLILGKIIHSGVGKYLTNLLEAGRIDGKHFATVTLMKSELQSRILKEHEKIIKVFGLKYGVTHTEIFIEKRTNRIVLCEIAARPPGMGVYELYTVSHSVDIYQLLCKSIISTDIDATQAPHSSAGLLVFNPSLGELKSVDDLNLLNQDFIVRIEQNVNIGDVFTELTYLNELGRIIISDTNEENNINNISNLMNSFKYEILPI